MSPIWLGLVFPKPRELPSNTIVIHVFDGCLLSEKFACFVYKCLSPRLLLGILSSIIRSPFEGRIDMLIFFTRVTRVIFGSALAFRRILANIPVCLFPSIVRAVFSLVFLLQFVLWVNVLYTTSPLASWASWVVSQMSNILRELPLNFASAFTYQPESLMFL